MLYEVRVHNRLNGNVFSLIEFLLVSFAAGLIAIGDYIHGKFLFTIVDIGWILNCLTVCVVAAQSLLKKEESTSIFQFLVDKELRKKVATQYPKLSRHTVVGYFV